MSDGQTVGLTSLGAAALGDALRSGIFRLFAAADHLNKINVFPVPDGDTGTNLSMTCASILAVLDDHQESHAGALLVRVADAALDGARGNSGAILAQFLHGLADGAETLAEISVPAWVVALRKGSNYAHDALTEPCEGTILTIVAELANAAEALVAKQKALDFGALYVAVLPPVRAALAATRNGLAEMRAANVEDAGAAGFVALLEGMAEYCATGKVGERVDLELLADDTVAPMAPLDTSYRYCTECLVSGEDIDQRHLREALSSHGVSLVVAGTRRKTKVHLHTNDPESLFATARRFGVISGEKADDMLAQQHATHHLKTQRIAVVTDSAADIPDEILENLDLQIVPLRVHFGARSYLDKVSLTPAEFYRELAVNPDLPKTSQPPAGDFRRLYEFLASHFEAVVSISVSSRVSGTYNAAKTAAQRIGKSRIQVVDSRTVSLAQGLIAIEAARSAQRGADLPAVLASIDRARASITTFALLPRLDFAVRGGRIPKAFKSLADTLRLAIVLAVRANGDVTVGGAHWGRHNLTARFANRFRRQMRSNRRYRVVVGHGDAPEQGHQLLAAIIAGQTNIESQHLLALGTALGAHGGPGTLVAAIMECEPVSQSAV